MKKITTFPVICVWLILLLFALPVAADDDQVIGELAIPAVSPLSDVAVARLRELARTDPEAKALATEVIEAARPLLDSEPRPLDVIHYEGLVNTDPKRIASVENLRDMANVSRLVLFWQITGDDAAAATLRRYIRAWTGTYRHTGNDVNENKLYPLLVAYHALRETFEQGERAKVDAWVEKFGEMHLAAVKNSTHFTNRYSKHVRLLAISGMILEREAWVAEAHRGIQRFVAQSLYGDGTSRDLKHRDTLTYHGSSLKPPIELAMIAGKEGLTLYAWENEQGGSLKKSVDYVVPFALGEKEHREWVNTKVDLDRRRAAAGLEKYQPGRLYRPQDALELMEMASYFDPSLLKVVRHLTESDAKRFPTLRTLVNEAARAGFDQP